MLDNHKMNLWHFFLSFIYLFCLCLQYWKKAFCWNTDCVNYLLLPFFSKFTDFWGTAINAFFLIPTYFSISLLSQLLVWTYFLISVVAVSHLRILLNICVLSLHKMTPDSQNFWHLMPTYPHAIAGDRRSCLAATCNDLYTLLLPLPTPPHICRG